MDSLFWSIIMLIVGSVVFTSISYGFKYMHAPDTKFNGIYVISALLSMFLVILLTPIFLLPGILPFSVSGFTGNIYIIISALAMGITANWIINIPLSYMLKLLSEANIMSTNVTPNAKHVLMIAATLGLIFLISGASVYAAIQYEASIHTTGGITGVGVKIFSDASLSNEITEISWGLREPGSSKSVTLYVLNTGNTPANLYFYITDWEPATAQDYMTVTWDYMNLPITPNAAMIVHLTLNVSEDISGITNFSFDITIVAEST